MGRPNIQFEEVSHIVNHYTVAEEGRPLSPLRELALASSSASTPLYIHIYILFLSKRPLGDTSEHVNVSGQSELLLPMILSNLACMLCTSLNDHNRLPIPA